jgi:uncharacterized surface protein with fasciclin (FAS1) repeats
MGILRDFCDYLPRFLQGKLTTLRSIQSALSCGANYCSKGNSVKLKRILTTLTTAALITSAVALSPSANAQEEGETKLGLNALTNVLDVAEYQFDSNLADFDILTYLALDVMGAKPKSAVWALADGNVKMTAFLPTDRAFKKLVKALTGTSYVRERKIYLAVRALGFDTVEKVLLYHVVLGAPILSEAAVAANGADLTTAEGSTIRVAFDGTTLKLRDKDTKRINPNVILTRVDINEGNNQVAHPINGVLLPKLG